MYIDTYSVWNDRWHQPHRAYVYAYKHIFMYTHIYIHIFTYVYRHILCVYSHMYINTYSVWNGRWRQPHALVRAAANFPPCNSEQVCLLIYTYT